jgi:two-component system, sensor histidine kinase and response regulator
MKIEVPAPTLSDGKRPAPKTPDQAPLMESVDHKVNILMVDDDVSKIIAHQAVLADLNQNIVTARSGRAALECLLRHDFAVILLDVNMPELDGFEIAEMIRERPRFQHTPIIFLTAYNTGDLDRLKGYNKGAADFLYLPVVPEVLKAKVKTFVDLAKQQMIIQKQAENLAEHNRRQLEQIRTIQELNSQLSVANEELESFSYSVSHDLRSPLRAMQGYSQALIEDCKGKLTGESEEYLLRISKAARRMDILIQDILAYTRISRLQLDTHTIDLEALVRDIVRDNLKLREYENNFCIQSPLHKVLGHEACLTQCFSNLLENAVKFIPKEIIPKITIRTELNDQKVRIWIEDNGIGIDPSHHLRIFQMFGRVYPESLYDGTGIGLSIVKKAAERMGGAVGVESVLGQGSRFWIELPKG